MANRILEVVEAIRRELDRGVHVDQAVDQVPVELLQKLTGSDRRQVWALLGGPLGADLSALGLPDGEALIAALDRRAKRAGLRVVR